MLKSIAVSSANDCACALAEHIAGSESAFVDLMNQKLQALGLSATAHFTNCVGLYDENHYCTIYDADIAKNFDRFSPLAQLNQPKEKIHRR